VLGQPRELDQPTPLPSHREQWKRKHDEPEATTKRRKVSGYLAKVAMIPLQSVRFRESLTPSDSSVNDQKESGSSETETETEFDVDNLDWAKSEPENVDNILHAADLFLNLGLHEESSPLYHRVWWIREDSSPAEILSAICGSTADVEFGKIDPMEFLRRRTSANDFTKELRDFADSLVFVTSRTATTVLMKRLPTLVEGRLLADPSTQFMLYRMTMKTLDCEIEGKIGPNTERNELQDRFMRIRPGPFELESNFVCNPALQDILSWCHLQILCGGGSIISEALRESISEEYQEDVEFFNWIEQQRLFLTKYESDILWSTEAALYLFLWERYQQEPPAIPRTWSLSPEHTLKTICSLILEELSVSERMKVDQASVGTAKLLSLSRLEMARTFLDKLTAPDNMLSCRDVAASLKGQARYLTRDFVERYLKLRLTTIGTVVEPGIEFKETLEAAQVSQSKGSAADTSHIRHSYNPTLASSLRSSDWSYKLFKSSGRSDRRASRSSTNTSNSKIDPVERLSGLMGSVRLSATQRSTRESQISLSTRASLVSAQSTGKISAEAEESES
jgi:hypothetical protein